MKKYYIIELGGEKEVNEMIALELEDINQAIIWIEDTMESDEDYFNININCDIKITDFERGGSDLDFYCQALVTVEYDSVVTSEMMESDIYSPEDIITSNLSIVSKITKKLIEA